MGLLSILKRNQKLSIPKVKFKNSELKIEIGRWLEIEDASLKEITMKFGIVLKLIGIDDNETCILRQYDRQNCSFVCHLSNKNQDINITLVETWHEDFPEIIIHYPKGSKTYEYHKEFNSRPTRLLLTKYTVENSENGNLYCRSLSAYHASFTLQRGEYRFSIKVDRPENSKPLFYGDYMFRLLNEEELQTYLLGLSFPLQIDEVYKRICQILINSIGNYPNFKLNVEKIGNEENRETIDMLLLHYGQLNQFVREGKMIPVDGNGNWSYNSSGLMMDQNAQDNSNVDLSLVSSNELSNTTSIGQDNMADQGVEQVKESAKVMLKAKGN